MNDSPHPHCSSANITRQPSVPQRRKQKIEQRERPTDIRVPEHEPLVQLVLDPIHLAPDDTEQSLAVDQHFHPILLHRLVERARSVHVLEMVRQARTPPVLDPYPDHLGLWLGKQIP